MAPLTDADFDVERAALRRAQVLERALGTPAAGGTVTSLGVDAQPGGR